MYSVKSVKKMNDLELIGMSTADNRRNYINLSFLFIYINLYIFYISCECSVDAARCFFVSNNRGYAIRQRSQGSRRRFIVCDYKNI